MADTVVLAQAVIDAGLARYKDEDETQWADAELLAYLNKAYSFTHQLLIRQHSPLVVTSGDLTVSTGTTSITLATTGNLPNFWGMAPKGVYFAEVGVPLTPISYEDKIREGTTTSDSLPTMYYLTDTEIGLANIPTKTAIAIGTVLYCRYYKANTALSLTTAMPYKNLFNVPMGMFMDSMAFLRKKDSTEELNQIYNILETTVLEIAHVRDAKGVA